MNRIRQRLAQLINPYPFIRDPFPDEGGVVVMYSSPRENKYRLTWAIRAEKFRMKTSNRLRPLDYGKDDFTYRPSRSYTRFVGTVGEPS